MSIDSQTSSDDSEGFEAESVVARPNPSARRAAIDARRGSGKKYGRWIGLGLLAGVIALVASTVRPGRGAFVYSKYVDEVMADSQRFIGTDIRVEGVVEAGTVENRAGSSEYRFHIERNHRSMAVFYSGIVPDTFREGIGVTVRGRLARDGLFTAREVVAKCPSKYEMQAAQARGQTMPGGIPNALGAPPARP